MKPNPIFSREKTTVINDGWIFSFDNANWQKINVPYCPESKLSGIGYTDFIPVCYYKKSITVKKTENRLMLHFGAVDYHATIYVNNQYAGEHVGGYTSFAVDITDLVADGENEIFMVVRDGEKGKTASGKQSQKRQSYGCFYTRTTGIWQSVWLEEKPVKYIKEVYFYPNVQNTSVKVDLRVSACGKYSIEVLFNGRTVGSQKGEIEYRKTVAIALSEKHLWKLGEGNLYDVKIRFEEDEVSSYFGLREVTYQGYDFLLNGVRCYQKLVLDQGYYPDGIYTAMLEEMQKDIDRGLELGFNGARLHQKLFDPQFLYLCDKAGYMVWGEYASWGIDYSNLDGVGQFLKEWQEALKRDFNHPSIVVWCPLNEAWGDWNDARKKRDVRFVNIVYNFTKEFDSTRPCVDVSGGHHGKDTDLYDFHCYEPLPNLKKYLDAFENKNELDVPLLYCKGERRKYKKGLPVNLSECGGYSLSEHESNVDTVNEGAVQSEDAWGYGKGETDANAFVKRYEDLLSLISKYKKLSGFCYTQLYDIEQEQNGFYRYDRSDKLTIEQKRRIFNVNNLLD